MGRGMALIGVRGGQTLQDFSPGSGKARRCRSPPYFGGLCRAARMPAPFGPHLAGCRIGSGNGIVGSG